MELDDQRQALLESTEPVTVFRDLSVADQGRIFLQLPEPLQEELVKELSRNELRRFVSRLDPDEATDILQLVSKKRRRKILKKLNREFREKVQILLRFHPETAAGVMNLDYVTVNKDMTFGTVSEKVSRYEGRTGRFPTVLVTDRHTFIGELPGSAMAAQENRDEKIGEHVQETPTVPYDTADDTVIETFRAHPHGKVVVLDDNDSVMGVIYSDDILRLIEEDAGETLYEFAGVSKEENVLDGPLQKVKRRYRWLIINLGTAFLAASVVGLFEQTIAAFTLLAVYMPIVAGMGGNAGTQTMAVVVRGIALNEVTLATGGRVIGNEIIAGAINGAINGILVAAIAFLWNSSPLLGLVIGVSMILNLIIAAFFGATIPLALKWLDQDPATSATIFITTATDVLGFFIFLGLATVVM